MAVLQPIPPGEQARDPSPKIIERTRQDALVPQAPLVAKPQSTRRNALVVVAVVAIAGFSEDNCFEAYPYHLASS